MRKLLRLRVPMHAKRMLMASVPWGRALRFVFLGSYGPSVTGLQPCLVSGGAS